MNCLKSFAVAAVALMLTNSVDAAKAKKVKPLVGTVVEVKKDKDANTIVVKVVAKKKKKDPAAAAEAPKEMTFKLSDATKFSKIAAKGEEPTDIKLDDVQKDARVKIVLKEKGSDEAVSITVMPKGKKAAQ